ncbi:MAG: SRPBCC domain-containing protein [Acidimicrobiia bacterium]
MPDTNRSLKATASTKIEAATPVVWQALVDPELIKQYMFGTEVLTDWVEGSEIRWAGEWKGSKYEDKGKILVVDPPHVLSFSHFSPLTGQPDVPENYHTVRIELLDEGQVTDVTLTQDNNHDDQARAHSEENWQMMLDGLKTLVEAGGKSG